MAALSEAERAQVKAAHDKAIQQDPSLDQKMKAAQQAMEQARKSLHDAMIKLDPSVEPILGKMMPPKWGGKREGGPATPSSSAVPGLPAATNSPTNPAGWGHHEPPGIAKLSEDERQQLKVLHEKVKDDPAVMAARQAKDSATSPAAREAAEEALHQTMHDAMIKADPTVEAILLKLKPAGGGALPSSSPSATPMAQ